MDFELEYRQAKELIEHELSGCFVDPGEREDLFEAMRYSLLAGGKRIRPVLTLKFCEAMCGDMDPAVDYACGVEMLHTYSLIHDDLPCMDNDDLRRGKPTCHRMFGECTAVLAGDALQAEAFYRLASSGRARRPEANGQACAILAGAAGAQFGICAGQQLDMAEEGRAIDVGVLRRIHMWKTASLLKAACLLGLVASSKAPTEAQWEAASLYAEELGMAFQIRDDMLDQESTTEELGKPVGSDMDNEKTTFATLYGLEKCRELVAEHTLRAKRAVETMFDRPQFLMELADQLAARRT